MNIRKHIEKREAINLSAYACHSVNSLGRLKIEPLCTVRTLFQHDRDRILHSKSFRRLKHKTQVFLSPEGDHYRTRLTHTLEVSQVARTVARALELNEDLTEAIALGHDLGHTPFGHAGERVLNELMPGGFRHVAQSLRVVDFLEKDGEGLNLTHEVRDGILRHSKGRGPLLAPEDESRAGTLEGQIVRLADIIAYVNHDLDDAIRGGVIMETDLPTSIVGAVGDTHAHRIGRMVSDLIEQSMAVGGSRICLSEEMDEAIRALRSWLFERVYESDAVHSDFVKASRMLRELFNFFIDNEAIFLREGGRRYSSDSLEVSVADFIAGMTDRFALALYSRLFLPQPWRPL
ncbi:deoxyguanosinetriphosphate triphosphohydrolase [Geopsychrobacter electrodiphilus]|uniref:deoxyguanosinetriphosphate triphosphohydrolase n=1 Tax=Geopsychrobacter electrodiphilus TaxID=225196 RepID=UPI0003A78744|nr:deoxyguanosinetriphosphate triphosphohydrolase [Geopsychrobacter electrodiphilus]